MTTNKYPHIWVHAAGGPIMLPLTNLAIKTETVYLGFDLWKSETRSFKVCRAAYSQEKAKEFSDTDDHIATANPELFVINDMENNRIVTVSYESGKLKLSFKLDEANNTVDTSHDVTSGLNIITLTKEIFTKYFKETFTQTNEKHYLYDYLYAN
jgi:hypothetical protein